MPNLLRLIYASRATGTIDPSSLEVLMNEARLRNDAAGITGVLFAGRGSFVQALEGPETPVASLYGRILRDERHHQAALLHIGLVSSRAFPQWAMAFVEGEPLGGEFHARLVDRVLVDRDVSEPVRLLQATLKALRKAS